MQEKSMIKSAFILTLGNVVSRIIGVLYVFLFSYLVSSRGLALYSYAYIPYIIFLDLATLGIPIGVMKLISLNETDDQLRYSYYIYKRIKWVSFLLGISMFLLMYFSSDALATMILAGEDSIQNNVRDVSNVIKIISTALIIIPNLSLLRGIFNSIKYTRETAYSQIIEQLVRVMVILLASFIIIKLLNLSYVYAIYLSVLAATISGLSTYVMMLFKYNKLLAINGILKTTESADYHLNIRDILKTLVKISVPVVLITMMISLYSFIDTLTFNQAYLQNGYHNSETIFGTYAFEISKLIMLPTALGVSLGVSMIVYAKDHISIDFKSFNHQIIKSLQMLFFIIFPIIIFFMVFNQSIYASLFSSVNPYGPKILFSAAPLIILFSLINITNGVIQSLRREWLLVISMLSGVGFKYIYNIAFIGKFEYNGAILATYIGLLITLIINLSMIYAKTKIQYTFLVRRLLTIILISSVLGGVFYLVNFQLFDFNLPSGKRVITLFYVGLNVFLFGTFYIITSYYLGIIDIICGREIKLGECFKFLNMKTLIKERRNVL